MRKVLFILGVLLSLSMFWACSDEFDSESSDGIVVLTPININERVDFATLSDFFNSELLLSNNTYGFFVDTNSDEDICKIINSREELQSIYSGNKLLPDIDFQQYTLIIGRKVLPEAYHTLIRQDANLKKDVLRINLYINHLDGFYCMMQQMGFWGLYPKFQAEKVLVNVIEVE